jgi:hypothetical protein
MMRLIALLIGIAACGVDASESELEAAETGSGSGWVKHGHIFTGANNGHCHSETACVCETTHQLYASLTCGGSHTDSTITCGQTLELSHCEDFYCASICKDRNPDGCQEDCFQN